MRSLTGALSAAVLLLLPSLASAQTPTPTPMATATPADVKDDDMPTVTDDDAGQDDWQDRSRGGGVILGLRAGFHGFEPAGIADGGPALEAAAAVPITGPWYVGATAGYRTGFAPAGYDEPSPKKRFFDAQYFSVEGQYRHNLGSVNVIGGLGVGVVSANSAEVTNSDGSATSASGSGPQVHAVAAALYPMGKLNLVAQLKYGVAPIAFKQTDETVGMGGLTVGVGADFPF